ncbi:MAG TPA: S46 family peptidase [Bacteroidetes bacterium]|nr:S46 family peptidase [Bacteroidota bacterium]
MKKLILSLTLIGVVRLFVFAGEGMWLPLLLSLLNESEMKEMGMKMDAEDIYSVNKSSLKDAIVRFGRGCTAEVISGAGLLLTNHHCGYGQIQAHSSLEHNYLEEGFWAMNRNEELPNPGLTATFIIRMEDVTKAALAGVTDNMDRSTRQSTIDKNLNAIREMAQKEEWQEVMIRPFFHGNQYFLFVTETFKDVRLVGAPPSSIGKFGADTDNWVWPRHTGDFSLFRIYADQNNRPAEYSKNNRPYQPRHFLPISLDGVAPDDFTLVFGFPGRTNEYLPAVAVEQIRDVTDPAKISIRDRTLAIWNAAMRADPEVKIQYASKQSGLANGWKKWQGEVLGLRSSDGIEKKKAKEAQFQKIVATNPKFKKYLHLLPQMEKRYKEIEPYSLAKTYFDEITGRNVEILRLAGYFHRLVSAWENEGREGFNNFRERLLHYLNGFYENYRPEIDEEVFAVQMEMMNEKTGKEFLPEDFTKMLDSFGGDYEKMAATVFNNSFIDNAQQALATLNMAPGDVMKALQNDPAFVLAKAFRQVYNEKIMTRYNQLNEQIADMQRVYMKALMEVFPNDRFYPDANGTLRCSYGRVEGYEPRDALCYKHQTYLEGVMEKYVPGDYEFDLPAKLRKLYYTKNYGRYGEKGPDGKIRLPVCFIGSNHTTGGNSGSPAIDAYGNLVGLNFDRVWEGTMSDYNFDLKRCRNIMVDIRYIFFIVEKYAGAAYLLNEVKFVYPKTHKKSVVPGNKGNVKMLKPEKMHEIPRKKKTAKQ